MSKKCTDKCKYRNQYNDNWVECYHPKYRGCKKPVSMDCLLSVDPKKEKHS